MARLLRSRSVLVAVIAAVAIVGVVALAAAEATTPPDLPSVPADRLIASSITAEADRALSVSGTVRSHVDLGIPQLPGTASLPTGPLSILLSDQTFKVWRSLDGIRVAQLLPAAERDAVLTRTDAWLWDSDRFAAWHAALPGAATAQPASPGFGDVEAAVSQLLTRLEPFAFVTNAPPAEVAGRPTYVVRLTPSPTPTSDTLVDRIEVAIDAATRVPLRLDVYAVGVAEPVVRLGYTAVSFDSVDPSVFDFTPPDGAAVHELGRGAPPDGGAMSPGAPEVRSFGTGFGLILAVSVPSVPKDLAPFFPYRGPIASADVVDRGDHAWMVAGVVRPDALARVERKLT
jgi:outer membrane lipoprotein-sorting protein